LLLLLPSLPLLLSLSLPLSLSLSLPPVWPLSASASPTQLEFESSRLRRVSPRQSCLRALLLGELLEASSASAELRSDPLALAESESAMLRLARHAD